MLQDSPKSDQDEDMILRSYRVLKLSRRWKSLIRQRAGGESGAIIKCSDHDRQTHDVAAIITGKADISKAFGVMPAECCLTVAEAVRYLFG